MTRIAARTALGLAIAIAFAACQPAATATPAPSPSAAPPTSPLEGVVTKVDSGGLNEVSSFDLRTNDGQTYTISVGQLENAAEFPPGHLREHMATSSLVRVFFTVEGSELVATRLEDAD
jgi:hypothetical protein